MIKLTSNEANLALLKANLNKNDVKVTAAARPQFTFKSVRPIDASAVNTKAEFSNVVITSLKNIGG